MSEGEGSKPESRQDVRIEVRPAIVRAMASPPHVSTTRESYEAHPRVLVMLIAAAVLIAALGFVLGGWVGAVVGLALSVTGIWLGPPWRTRIREHREYR